MNFHPLLECPVSLASVASKFAPPQYALRFYAAVGNENLHFEIMRQLPATVDENGVRYFMESSQAYVKVKPTCTRVGEYDVCVIYEALGR